MKRFLLVVIALLFLNHGANAANETLFCSGPYGIGVGTSTCPTDGTVNVATSGVGYNLGGLNAIRLPSNESTAGGSIAIGAGALAGQTGSSANYRNTAVGYQACGNGTLTTAAVKNTCLGYQALAALTTGTFNVAVGHLAASANTTGIQNTALGNQALTNNLTGSDNVAIGTFTLIGAGGTSFGGNTAVGSAAMPAVTTAYNNTALGASAANKITTGGGNVVLGYSVASTTLATGTNNILIGVDSSTDTGSSSTSNSLIIKGTGTAVISTTGTNSAAPVTTFGGPTIQAGTKFTVAGSGGGCGTLGTVTGGATAGTFNTTNTGACQLTVTFSGATGATAPNGWLCAAENNTTANLFRQTSSTTTTATFAGVTVASDVLQIGPCTGI